MFTFSVLARARSCARALRALMNGWLRVLSPVPAHRGQREPFRPCHLLCPGQRCDLPQRTSLRRGADRKRGEAQTGQPAPPRPPPEPASTSRRLRKQGGRARLRPAEGTGGSASPGPPLGGQPGARPAPPRRQVRGRRPRA